MIQKIKRWAVTSTARLAASLFASLYNLRGAAAGSLGLFIGMLPLGNYRFALLFLVSLFLQLNLLALLLGLSITMLVPYFHLLSYSFGERLFGHEAQLDSSLIPTVRSLEKWALGGSTYWIGSLAVGALLAVVAFPFFLMLFNLPRKAAPVAKDYVFRDPAGRRWPLLRRLVLLGISITIIIVLVFSASISSTALLPNLSLGKGRLASGSRTIDEKLSEKQLIQQLKDEDRKHPTFQLDFRKHRNTKIKTTPSAPSKQEVYGFYVNWDESSKQSLLQYGKMITTLLPEWMHLKSDFSIDDQTDPNILRIAKSQHLTVEPLLNNFSNNRWDGETLHALLQSPDKQTRLIETLLANIKAANENGINVDFEDMATDDQDLLTAFMEKLTEAFHASGLIVTEDVPADDHAFDYGALAKIADRLIVMMYDEHSESGTAGPIASSNWFEQSLNQLDIPPDKMVVSLGSYGYDWTEGSSDPADSMTFGDIIELAQQSKLSIHWDDEGDNPYLRYKESGDTHIIWFLDAATFYNQLKTVQENGFRGVAVWRLGSEDPGIWKLLDSPSPGADALSTVYNASPVHYSGEGEILRINSSSSDGKRQVEMDQEGYVADETYTTYPIPYEIQRFGKPKNKQVVLTFDDGPNDTYTPEILDILKRYGIKAAFFVVGENAEMHPDLITRIYREGHELGNHTFTHPNVATISALRTRMELNATQRLIEEITGHSMTFFRPPYVADAEPSTPSELLPIIRAQDIGYTMAGELIDPEDWARPSTGEIVRRVLSQLHEGNVILLHDAGGNRSETVEALPQIIEAIQKMGYTFTTLSALIGKTRTDTMPAVSIQDVAFMNYDRTVFNWLENWNLILQGVFYCAIGIGILRVLLLGWLSWRHKRASRPSEIDNDYKPAVSVVIAAYNEEAVICKTIGSILDSDYPHLEIIVIDDGSTDETSKVVEERFSENDRVRLIRKANGGKASAVNAGFREASGTIIVAFDADTLISSDAISLLVSRFRDEKVAAVSGNVRIGNTGNLLTIWQHIEYVTGFNLERRAFDRLNCISVVPGAIGAWRKSAVIEAGLYSEDTLAEDADLTLSLLTAGYRVYYEERALAYTEAPEDVRSLSKQRFRWTYGTLQCLWKHRKSLFNRRQPALGFIGMPNMWLFQYVYSVLSPVIDLLFIFSLFGRSSEPVILFYISFFLLDLSVAYYAFRLERINPRPLVWLFLQRIVYRQLMTYVILKSIFAAIRGSSVGWNKIKRKGNARMQKSEQ
ncbi:DUF2062 domain-containing protein [Gorillibacterium massiliense]|uniref:DUF2062 domain-containing protein n=1 Tax=Gorillibacterium massiliense TaxID=1280390 RepID=UPI0004B60668|nr:DUF2062 domain-containing protein [Gorillibacterium massiliense]